MSGPTASTPWMPAATAAAPQDSLLEALRPAFVGGPHDAQAYLLMVALSAPQQPWRWQGLGDCSPQDPQRLRDALDHHRAAPLLQTRLRAAGTLGALPESARAQLRDLSLHEAARSAARERDLRRIVAALAADGIETLLLKGAHLARTVYASPSQRPMSDLDLLVHEHQLRAAYARLLALGYTPESPPLEADIRRGHQMPRLLRPGHTAVELHWRLHDEDSAAQLPAAPVWQRSQPCPELPGARLPAPEDALLHVCLHLSMHHGFAVPVLALHDVAACLGAWPALDWPALLAQARAIGALPHVAAPVLIAAELFQAPVPAQARAALQPFAPAPELAQALLAQIPADTLGRDASLRFVAANWPRWRAALSLRYALNVGTRLLSSDARLPTGPAHLPPDPVAPSLRDRLRVLLDAGLRLLRSGRQRRWLRAHVDARRLRERWMRSAT